MTSKLINQLVDSEIKVSELTSDLLAKDSEILRLEAEIVNLKSQLNFKSTLKSNKFVQTDTNLSDSSATCVAPEQKYLQRISDLELKLIESDSRNYQLDILVRSLHKTIDELTSQNTVKESLSPVKTLSTGQQRVPRNPSSTSQLSLKSVNSVSTYFKKHRKQACSFSESN